MATLAMSIRLSQHPELHKRDCRQSKRSAETVRRCRDGATLRRGSVALFGHFADLFAILAADRKRKGAKPRCGDLAVAFEAAAVGAFLEPSQSCIDSVEGLRLHL
jgi:hypothetical protein